MARIRTFKPDFFRSPDTAKASPRARILYLAMWSWADDAGIGETNIYGLLGFAFPDSDGVTAEELPSLLKEVRGSFGVVFYSHRGRFYYAIPTFDKHQRTERKAQGKFPGPDDPESLPDLRFDVVSEIGGISDATIGGSAPGTGEQGNRGTGEIILVGATEVCHQGADDVAPPQKCSRHLNMQYPPDCGGCAAARRAHREWKDRQARGVRETDAAKKAERSAIRAAIAACDVCDENGIREVDDETSTWCDHVRDEEGPA